MNVKMLSAVSAAAFVILGFAPGFGPGTAQAFECVTHIAAADRTLADFTQEMNLLKRRIEEDEMTDLHALRDDARLILNVARHDHENPHSDYDHARAIAKANAARGYALAALKLLEFYAGDDGDGPPGN